MEVREKLFSGVGHSGWHAGGEGGAPWDEDRAWTQESLRTPSGEEV